MNVQVSFGFLLCLGFDWLVVSARAQERKGEIASVRRELLLGPERPGGAAENFWIQPRNCAGGLRAPEMGLGLIHLCHESDLKKN